MTAAVSVRGVTKRFGSDVTAVDDVSLDIEDGEFWWPEANDALFLSLKETIMRTDNRQIVSLPHHVNDPEFAASLAAAFQAISHD